RGRSCSEGSSLGCAAGRLPERRGRRFVRRWLVRFVGGYLVVVFIMWLLENKLVFLPTKAADGWNPPPEAAIKYVYPTSPAGRKIHAWHLPGEPDSPVLLVFPGNGGNLSGRSSTLLDARQWLGVPAMVFDYPGYGKSEGSPNEENCYDAAE